jgi:type I restriction enzyme, S subunit
MSIRHLPFLDVFEDASGGNIKTPNKEFLEDGEIPVIDQGQSVIAGYVNDPSKICKSKPPVIVFGDHTKAIKYVDFPFAMGADGTKVLVPKDGGHTKYLFYALRALHIPDAGYSRHYKFLKETTIPLPPLAEQKRIAGILDAADALRAKRREALAQLDSLLQSTFLDLFGDPVTNPMGWEASHLSGIAHSIVDGPFGSNLKSSDYVTDGVPVLQGKNITGNSFRWFDIRFISSTKAKTVARSDARVDDHLLIKIGSIGYSAIIDDLKGHQFAIIPANMCRIRRDSKKVEALFLHAFLTTKRIATTLRGLASKTAQPALSLGKIRALSIPLPPLPLQKKFATIVESIERQKITQRAHLAELDALFAAFQHRAFCGEL